MGQSPHDSLDGKATRDRNPMRRSESDGYSSQSHHQWGISADESRDGCHPV